MRRPFSSSPYPFLGLVILFLLIRGIYAWFWISVSVEGDALSYFEEFLRLFSGATHRPFWAPGLPLLMAWIGINFAWYPLSLVMFALACFLLMIFGLYAVLSELYPPSFSLFPIALLGFMPISIHFSIVPLTQLPLAGGLIWLYYLLIRAWKKKLFIPKGALIGGAILGMCILIRPSSLILIPFIGYIWFRLGKNRALGLYALSLGMVLGAWQVRNVAMGHPYVFINASNSSNFFIGNNPYTPRYKTWWLGSHLESANPAFDGFYKELGEIQQYPEAMQQREYIRHAWNYIYEEPAEFAIRTVNRIKVFWTIDTYTAGFLYQHSASQFWPFLAIGGDFIALFILFWYASAGIFSVQRDFHPFTWIRGFILFMPLPYYFAFSHPTYHFPLLPFLCVLALKGPRKQDLLAVKGRPLGIWILRLIFILIQIEWILSWKHIM